MPTKPYTSQSRHDRAQDSGKFGTWRRQPGHLRKCWVEQVTTSTGLIYYIDFLGKITATLMFKVPAYTRPQSSKPFVNHIVNNRLLHVCPAVNEASPQLVNVSNTLLVHPLLQHSSDSVYEVHVRTVGRPCSASYPVS